MRGALVFSIISIILLSGCTAKVVQTETTESKQPVETQPIETQPTESRIKPQLTSTEGAIQKAKITTDVTTEVTKAPVSELPINETREPRTFQVNIVQGIGIKDVG